jgi:hypothetical protein
VAFFATLFPTIDGSNFTPPSIADPTQSPRAITSIAFNVAAMM